VTLDEQLPIHVGRLFEINIQNLRREVGAEHRVARFVFDRLPLMPRALAEGSDGSRDCAPAGCATRSRFHHRPAASEPFTRLRG
jgi:hypothetical protein